jgi:hypothetical protein
MSKHLDKESVFYSISEIHLKYNFIIPYIKRKQNKLFSFFEM